jgi:putative transposase
MTADTRHHRRSIRIHTNDYAGPGAYFVTIVTADRACVFGVVSGDEMLLSDRGRIAHDCWQSIPLHFPDAELGAYVVMPNHVHGILVLQDRVGGPDGGITAIRRGMPWHAPTGQFGKPVSGSLATIIGQYKSSVTRLVV